MLLRQPGLCGKRIPGRVTVGFVFRHESKPVAHGLSVQTAITARVMSIPAETPEDVTTEPSSTQRALGTQFTFGPGAVDALKAILFVVAGLPSRMPAAASSDAPVAHRHDKLGALGFFPQPAQSCRILKLLRNIAAWHKQVIQLWGIRVAIISHGFGPLVGWYGSLHSSNGNQPHIHTL